MIKSCLMAFMALWLLNSCQSSPSPSSAEAGDRPADSVLVDHHYYFLHTFSPSAWDTIHADTMILIFTANSEGQASGTYRWVLPGKDGKFGKIEGTFSGDLLSGHYAYQQEGGNYNDSIQVRLQGDQAIVTQFSADNYQLTDTLHASKP